MARRKKTTGIYIYNLLLREATAINDKLPERRKLSLTERREFISKKVYPLYRNLAKRDIRITEIRETLLKKMKRLKAKPTCDVTLIPPDLYEQVPYYEIDRFFTQVMPNCVYVKLSAANFGETKIFNTRNYNYYNSNVSEITNRINEFVRQQSKPKRESGRVPFYSGYVQVRPNKVNDGKEDSYYLDMVLVVKGIEAKKVDTVNVPARKKTKREKSIRKELEEYTQRVRMEQSRVKKIRQSLLREIKDISATIAVLKKRKYFPKIDIDELLRKAYQSEIKKLDKQYAAKNITDEQYKSLARTAKKGFKQ